MMLSSKEDKERERLEKMRKRKDRMGENMSLKGKTYFNDTFDTRNKKKLTTIRIKGTFYTNVNFACV